MIEIKKTYKNYVGGKYVRSESGKTFTLSLKNDSFDFAFIDADKMNYIEYYKRSMMLIKPGGIIVLDNMLWSGKVLNPQDDDSKALNEAAEYINNDKRVFNHITVYFR